MFRSCVKHVECYQTVQIPGAASILEGTDGSRVK